MFARKRANLPCPTKVWDDVAVTEDSLTQCIVDIREPLTAWQIYGVLFCFGIR